MVARTFVKTCANPDCGRTFVAHHNVAKYCSDECQRIMYKQRKQEKEDEYRQKQKCKDIHKKYNTIDKTLEKCKKRGVSYAEQQVAKTLSTISKIILEI